MYQVWTEEGEEESEMTCSERLQAELQDDPGGGPPLIPVDPPDPPTPSSPREQDLTGDNKCVNIDRVTFKRLLLSNLPLMAVITIDM